MRHLWGHLAVPATVKRVHRWIDEHAHRTPDKAALICDGETVTYDELSRRVAALARLLLDDGIAAGERVCIDSTSGIDLLIGNIACMAVGVIAVPLPPLPKNADGNRFIVADCRPVLVVSGDSARRELLAAYDAPVRAIPGKDARPGETASALERAVASEDTAVILYTSGTSSGIRKGVMVPHLALVDSIDNRIAIMEITGEVVEYVASPIDTVFAFGRCRLCFQVGGTAVYENGQLNPARMLTALKKWGCNAIGGDSAIYILLLKHFERHLAEVAPQIRWVEIASQAMPVELKQKLLDLMPRGRLYMNFGLTEAIFSTVNRFGEVPGTLASAGRAAPKVDVRVVDDEDRPLPPGAVGEIVVRGTSAAVGYWNREALWDEVTRGGWYHTGDLGQMDAAGFLSVVGRKSDLVNVGGRKVAPDDVERLLQPHFDGVGIAVFGHEVPNSPQGEELVVAVEAGQAPDFKAIRLALQGTMPDYMIPSRMITVDHFPRTENGKVRRKGLRDLLAERES